MTQAVEQVDERPVTVAEGNNLVSVAASGNTWIALAQSGFERVRESNGAPETSFVVEPGEYTVRTDGSIGTVTSGQFALPPSPFDQPSAQLVLTSDAPDQHPVDAVGEVAADGKSYCTITIDKVAGPDRSVRGADEIFLRTTGGSIVDANGQRIRSVTLADGAAAVRLVSEATPRLVTVSAFSADQRLTADLPIEFV